MELPIPTHLKDFLMPKGDDNSEYGVCGNIYCSCGNDSFELLESNEKSIVNLIC